MNPEIEALRQEVAELKARLNLFMKTDKYLIEKNMQILDGRKIQLGITTGTTFGTGVTQKIGFYNKAPVAQQTAAQPYTAADIGGILRNLGLLTT